MTLLGVPVLMIAFFRAPRAQLHDYTPGARLFVYESSMGALKNSV